MPDTRPDALLLDLSGVLYQGARALPGALDALERLRHAGLPVRFVTNTSRRSHAQLLDDLRQRGFRIDPDELFTAPRAAHDWLQAHGRRPWCLLHPDLRADFNDLPGGDPDAVLIGDAEDDFTYANLDRAFRLLQDGAELVAIGVNRHFQLDDGLHLDAGPFVHALEYAAGCTATVTGKPAPAFFEQALASLALPAERVMMIGDDAASDAQGALDAGLRACLVKTGKYRPGDEDGITGDCWLEKDIGTAVARVLGHAPDRG